jgi:hypothetical protein
VHGERGKGRKRKKEIAWCFEGAHLLHVSPQFLAFFGRALRCLFVSCRVLLDISRRRELTAPTRARACVCGGNHTRHDGSFAFQPLAYIKGVDSEEFRSSTAGSASTRRCTSPRFPRQMSRKMGCSSSMALPVLLLLLVLVLG